MSGGGRVAGALLAIAAACAGQPPISQPGPARQEAAAGCYVVLRERQTAGPSLDFLFPAFFQLSREPAPAAAVPGRQVWLPADDLSRRAGSWSWIEDGDTLAVQSTAGRQGWQLRLRETPATWAGRIRAWAGDTLAEWTVTGRRVSCPAGLVPAAM